MTSSYALRAADVATGPPELLMSAMHPSCRHMRIRRPMFDTSVLIRDVMFPIPSSVGDNFELFVRFGCRFLHSM
jgi:hypothetical protein